MRASTGGTSCCKAFAKLVVAFVLLLGFTTCVLAISKRSEAFVGYAEKNEQHSKCSDSMDAEVCASYKSSRMCKTGVRGSPREEGAKPADIYNDATELCVLCRLRENRMQEDVRAVLNPQKGSFSVDTAHSSSKP